jgi:hypothetical protein
MTSECDNCGAPVTQNVHGEIWHIANAKARIVKPLVWREETPGYFFADDIGGETWRVHLSLDKVTWFAYRQSGDVMKGFATDDDAKAAANAEYTARVMSCLTGPQASDKPA